MSVEEPRRIAKLSRHDIDAAEMAGTISNGYAELLRQRADSP